MTEHEHPPKNTPGKKSAQNEVAKKTYAIYLTEGRPQGHDVQNWLEAEAQRTLPGRQASSRDCNDGGRSAERSAHA